MKAVDQKFILSSGDDTSCLDFMLSGGQGVISVISHVIPKELRAFADRARKKDGEVRAVYKRYSQLNSLMSVESNPIPVKMALYLMGIIDSPELRLPLVTLSEQNKKNLQLELTQLGVI